MLLYIAACNAPANMLPTVIVQALVSLNNQVLPYYSFSDAEEKRTKRRKRNREKRGDERTGLATMIKTNPKG